MVDTDDGRRITPWVWHKLPTGELMRENRAFMHTQLTETKWRLVIFRPETVISCETALFYIYICSNSEN